MKKEELKNPIVIISILLSLTFIVVLFKTYFVDVVIINHEKKEVSFSEKQDLEMLAMAYLTQNKDLKLNKFFATPTTDNRFNVAAEYYYLKNGKDGLDNYEEILEIAKQIFDSEYIGFSNFEVNIDEENCGKEKYTTINGIVYNESCDLEDNVIEISDIYESNSRYVVEFYIAKAKQKAVSSNKECHDFEKPLSYNLALTDLDDNEFYSEDYFRCCESDCILEGISPLEKEIINQVKNYGIVYKMIFSKNEFGFVFDEIKK